MDTTFVVINPDSALIHNWFLTNFPGIHDPFVAIVAAWLATRAIWIFKALVYATATSNIPLANKIMAFLHNVWRGDPTKPGDKGWGWLINPILMTIMGFFLSGRWDVGALLGFSGIGIREWLIKSPIPTSKEELNKIGGR